MSFRTAYPTLSRLIPALRGYLATAAHVALRLLALRWWTWRLTRRLVVSCATLATVIGCFYTVENWRGRRAFAAVEREAAALDVSLALREHAQPDIPDEQNLAKIPLLHAPADPAAASRFWSERSSLFQLRRLNRKTDGPTYPSSYSLPDVGRASPLDDHPADLTAFRAAVTRQAQENDHEDLDAFLTRTAPLLADIGAAALKRPYLVYPRDWDDPMSIIVPEVGLLRDLTLAALIHAHMAIVDGRPAQAADMLALPLRLSRAVQGDPTLLSQLTAAGINSLTLAVLWQGQATHAWTAAELERHAALLADDRILENLRRACAAETAWSVSIMTQLPQTIDSYPSSFAGEQDERLFSLFARWAPYGWLQQNAAAAARVHLREHLPSIDLDARRLHPDRAQPFQQRPRATFPAYDLLARMTMPDLRRVFQRIGQGKTQHDLARLAIALEKHFLTHGSYPDTLAPVLTDDPALAALHDQPYRYRRDADGGFTLWGVGQNRHDDGGTFPDANVAPGANRYDSGDLVWRIPGRSL